MIQWQKPPNTALVNDKEVHLWRIDINEFIPHIRYFKKIVIREQARIDRYVFEREKNTFTITRALLRIILGRYTGLEPADIELTYNACGKPFLGANPGTASLQFNLSHSHGMALIALTEKRRIGIDIEKIRPDIDVLSIHRRFHSQPEPAELKTSSSEDLRRRMFTWWTFREAFGKATGSGLGCPLPRFEMTDANDDSLHLMYMVPHEDQQWSLLALRPHPNYAGALAVEGSTGGFRFWDICSRDLRDGK